MTKLILTDIEGTTSSIAFVKEVLFPYAAEHLAGFVRAQLQQPDVQQALQDAATLAQAQGLSVDATDTEAVIELLQYWSSSDQKATPLKTLQGLIWQAGYEQGAYKAHLYPDAGRNLLQWYLKGIPLYVYSSGSVAAQQLFFAFNEAGNLLPLFDGFFDTHMGAKGEPSSYRNILTELQRTHSINASDVLFLSDSKDELDAAQQCGMQTYWLIRDGDAPAQSPHPIARTFADIVLR